MKKRIALWLLSVLLCVGCAAPGYALSQTQAESIQALLDEACRVSGVPGMSLALLTGGEMLTFSSGDANREKGLPASENTLYELASVSKAFTGLGILLLEEQGRLSMTDSVQAYLPWFSLHYQGKAVDMQSLTLNHFLHHTSGLTNGRHAQAIPEGSAPDMLQKTVEALDGAELAFSPGERYDYGTVNYDILGLVIEAVSGQSYEVFMNEQVFQPLGLHQTYLDAKEAEATGQLAQGYRSAFFMTMPYDAPEYAGNKPAGYIISCTKDMARWMGIQMGTIRDIPEPFFAAIEKSHLGDSSVPAVGGMYYAAGWTVNADRTVLEHGGENPSFRTELAILPTEETAVCLLSNGANTNIGLVGKVKEILDGHVAQSYEMSGTQLMEIALSSATIIFSLLAVLLFLLGLCAWKSRARQPLTKTRGVAAAALLTAAAAVCVACVALDWSYILVWKTYSILTAMLSSAAALAGGAWLILARR